MPAITLDTYLMGREHQYPDEYTKEIEQNAMDLLDRVNTFLHDVGIVSVRVDSGWRPKAINDATSNAATHSKHMTGQAVDLADHTGSLMKIVLDNLDKCEKYGLFFEDFRWTSNWVHFQSVKPTSGHRIFVPSTAPASVPSKWDGKYDPKFNA